MLDMEIGQLRFTINGVDQGIASNNEKLKYGKWYAAIILQDQKDQITMLNPRYCKPNGY
jgi:hypothetical protein